MENNGKVKEEPFESANVRQTCSTFDYETESLPLKGNADYQSLLSSLNMLTALRTQALDDINKVLEVQDKALADPINFVKKLEKGEDIGIPDRLVVPEIPELDWKKYTQMDAFRFTRVKTREVKPEIVKPNPSDIVRGRVKNESKSATFNQLWTTEEQFRLEELLMKYPPERNEARRFAKIAAELGNRTLQQVTSRCQKYFVKLAKQGMPVPGRVPRMKKENCRNQRPTKATSTFFPRTLPPVPVNEDGDLPGTSTVDVTRVKMEMDSEDSCDVSDGESRKVMLLRRVRADLSRHNGLHVTHSGYTCIICKESPLRGTRWHCMECANVDFCSGCLISQLEGPGPQHPLDHPLASYRPALHTNGDKDYSTDPTQYNYLDGNFRPD